MTVLPVRTSRGLAAQVRTCSMHADINRCCTHHTVAYIEIKVAFLGIRQHRTLFVAFPVHSERPRGGTHVEATSADVAGFCCARLL